MKPMYLETEDSFSLPFAVDGQLLFLGEIPNMPEHCVVYDIDKKQIHVGFHTSRFREIPESDV